MCEICFSCKGSFINNDTDNALCGECFLDKQSRVMSESIKVQLNDLIEEGRAKDE